MNESNEDILRTFSSVVLVSTAMEARKRKRISDEQRSILDKCYNDGMVGTGSAYQDKVDNAVFETGLTKAQVEVGEFIIMTFMFPDQQIIQCNISIL